VSRHDLVRFEECSLFNSAYEYARGYDRAVCSCGWVSAPLNDRKALVLLFDSHARRSAGEDPEAEVLQP